MRFIATLRVPPWVVLVGLLGIDAAMAGEGLGRPFRAIHAVIEPSLAHVLSRWIVLMIPVGLPLLYFIEGLVAHVGVALTGGASRSIGASMRACGYVLGAVLLVVGAFDIPLYLGMMSGHWYLPILGVLALLHWGLVGIALAKTHQISIVRGVLVSILPTLVLVVVTLARVSLELTTIPGMPATVSDYTVLPSPR